MPPSSDKRIINPNPQEVKGVDPVPQVVHSRIEIPDLHPVFQQAYERAVAIFSERIQMDLFTDRRSYITDVARVNERLKQISNECKSGGPDRQMAYVQSDVFEAMLFDYVSVGKWFGDKVTGILPSIYDDLFNGVDLILEQDLGPGAFSYAALAIDATFSSEGAVKKIAKDKAFIAEGRLSRIKYFSSEQANFRGNVDQIPHFVVGVDRPTLFSSALEYVQKGPEEKGCASLRRLVLEQICKQAIYYNKLLSEKGFVDEAFQYERVLSVLKPVLDSLPPIDARYASDQVHALIMQNLR